MRTSRPGFTLVETIFATLFIGVTVLAIVNLFPGAYLSIRRSETSVQADVLAKSIMDEWRLVSFENLIPGVYPLIQTPEGFDETLLESRNIEGVTYSAKTSIYDVPGTDPTFLKGARVTVQYRLGPSLKEVIHETYLHRLIR